MVQRIEPDQQVVLDRGGHARPRRPVPQRRLAVIRQRIDQLVRLAGLHHLAGLDMAAVAQLRQLAVDLLVIGLPEEADGGVEGLGELIARHRTFRQASEDRVAERHGLLRVSLTLCAKAHMRQCAYERNSSLKRRRPMTKDMAATGLAQWYAYMKSHDQKALWDLLHPDAVFESPVVHTPQRGRDITFKYLASAEKVLGGPGFSYVGEWRSADGAVLEFKNVIDGIEINGV